MTKKHILILTVLVFFIPFLGISEENKNTEAAPTMSSDLFPNDFGPDSIDVSSYPKEYRQSYRTFKFKCATCHTIARPINSQFLELSKEEQEKEKSLNPDLFKDKNVALIEDKIWNRYVKRMMNKPGCPVKKEDGKPIWAFLVYDSKIRKTGDNAKVWIEHRKKLLTDFKKNHHESYEKLFDSDEKSDEKKENPK